MIDPYDEGSALVRVRAQVMTRDDSSGGWVPMDGGGLSHVSVRKRLLSLPPAPVLVSAPLTSSTSAPGSVSSESCTAVSILGPSPAAPPPTPRGPGPPSPSSTSHAPVTRPSGVVLTEGMGVGLGVGHSTGGRHEYQILGRRISDQTVVLSCTIKKDFQYNKVMPTFHHWRTGDKKFGLTFQTAADARAFDKGVRMAVEELLDGWSREPAQYTLYPVHPWTLWPVVISDWSSVTGTRPSTADVSDDDVFMTLELPMERSETRPSSATSPRTSPSPPNQSLTGPATHHHLHRMHFLSRTPPSTSPLPVPVPVPALSQGNPGGAIRGGAETTEAIWQQREKEKEWEREKERRRREGDIWGWDGISTHGGKGCSSERIDVISALADKDKESYSYVQFSRDDQHTMPGFHSVHEYSYPMMPDPVSKTSVRSNASLNRKNQVVSAQPPLLPPSLPAKSPASGSSASTTSVSLKKGGLGYHQKKRRGSTSNTRSLEKGGSGEGGLLSGGNGKGGRLRCRHCQETYREESNPRGSCDFAPDPVKNCIETVSCLACAQCMLYHCYADSEGDFSPHPCSCSSGGGGVSFGLGSNSGGGSGLSSGHGSGISTQSGLGHGSAGRRWLGLALLSLLVPCLCCYLPLKACYKCGVHCGLCGQRHTPA